MLKEATHYYYANSRERQREREGERVTNGERVGMDGRC